MIRKEGTSWKSSRRTRCGRKRHFRYRRDTVRKPGSHIAGTGKTGACALPNRTAQAVIRIPAVYEPEREGLSSMEKADRTIRREYPESGKRLQKSRPARLPDGSAWPLAHVLACIEQKTVSLPFRPYGQGSSACRLPALAGIPDIGHRDDRKAVFFRKSGCFRHPRHRPVFIRQLAQHDKRRKHRQLHQIDAAFRIALAGKNAVFPGNKRKDMAGPVQIGRRRVRRNGCADRGDPVFSRNPGRHTPCRFDRNRENCPVTGLDYALSGTTDRASLPQRLASVAAINAFFINYTAA